MFDVGPPSPLCYCSASERAFPALNKQGSNDNNSIYQHTPALSSGSSVEDAEVKSDERG